MDFLLNNKTILIAPLDWGLGHTTRCIPIIRCLQANGCRVLLAASGNSAALLKQEFPDILCLELPGYNIRYSKGNLVLQLVKQLPVFYKSIKQEHSWLQKIIKKYNIEGVLSDNRYGLYSKSVPCVLITHQLQVQAPYWLKWTEPFAKKQVFKLLKNFTECWVPDKALAKQSIGQQLSHSEAAVPVKLQYIDWLTRFLPIREGRKRYKLMISLSGPEPQRTMLENKLLIQLEEVDVPVLLARGLPGNTTKLTHTLQNLTVVNHLSASEMQENIAASAVFLSRCGYSTLMDLQAVAVKCIFIPTPGQTEQEYLGKKIQAAKAAVVCKQANLHLPAAMQQAQHMLPYSAGNYVNKTLPLVIANWLATL